MEFILNRLFPGSDVSLALADGRVFTLAQSIVVRDLSIPANGTAALPLNLLIRDSKLSKSGSGTLTVNLRLRDPANVHEDTVQSIDTAVAVSLDLKSLVWNQTLNLAASKIQCQFSKLPIPGQAIAYFTITKAKASDQVKVQVATPGSTRSRLSPIVTLSDTHILSYYEQFNGSWTATNAVDFLNKLVAPNMPSGIWAFKACTTSVAP